MKYTIILRDSDGYSTVLRRTDIYLEFIPEHITHDLCVYAYSLTIGTDELIYDYESSYIELK